MLLLFCMFGNSWDLSVGVRNQLEKAPSRSYISEATKITRKYISQYFVGSWEEPKDGVEGGGDVVSRWHPGMTPSLDMPRGLLEPMSHLWHSPLAYISCWRKTYRGRLRGNIQLPPWGRNIIERKSSPIGRILLGKFSPRGGNHYDHCCHHAMLHKDHHLHHLHYKHHHSRCSTYFTLTSRDVPCVVHWDHSIGVDYLVVVDAIEFYRWILVMSRLLFIHISTYTTFIMIHMMSCE